MMRKRKIEQFEIKENWVYEEDKMWCVGIKPMINGKYIIEYNKNTIKYKERNEHKSMCNIIKCMYVDILEGGIHRYLPRGLSHLYYKRKM